MATRRRAREVALQMLFQFDASDLPPREVVELYKGSFSEGSLPNAFSIDLFLAIADSLGSIDVAIRGSSENWRLDRMSRVDRNILRIGVHEICFCEDVPVRVAINEAVELAKRYGTADSPAFVNGILDRVARDERRL